MQHASPTGRARIGQRNDCPPSTGGGQNRTSVEGGLEKPVLACTLQDRTIAKCGE